MTYGHAVDAGFFLDDTTSIRDQRVMMSDDPSSILRTFPMRAVGYYTFWANYQLFGESPSAFRVVNLAIHWLASVSVFVFAQRLLAITGGRQRAEGAWIAGFAALIFLCHPLQTGAVTYIVQRLASLAALLFMVALTAWLFLRTTKKGLITKFLLAIIFLGATALALNTKQNTFTLFPIIILLELLILRSLSLKQAGLGSVVAFGGFVAAIVLLTDGLEKLDAMTRDTALISRWNYFSHQWVVLFIYLKKIVWPSPLMLEYGYDSTSFSLSLRTYAAVGHFLILSGAIWLSRRVPLVSFGVLFFYVTHSVESGVIPIRDLVFEHRNYLPMLGICIALLGAVNCVLTRAPHWRISVLGCAITTCVFLSWLTYDRNDLWTKPEEFLLHDVRLSDNSPRALHNLASWYQQAGQYDKALTTMRSLITANGGSLSLTYTTTYLSVMLNVGLHEEVLDLAEKLLDFTTNRYERAIVLRYMGTAFVGVADDEAAVDCFEEAMGVLQLDYESGLSYGYALIQVGRIGDAFRLIDGLRRRFGEREKVRRLTKIADTALQRQRARDALQPQ